MPIITGKVGVVSWQRGGGCNVIHHYVSSQPCRPSPSSSSAGLVSGRNSKLMSGNDLFPISLPGQSENFCLDTLEGI